MRIGRAYDGRYVPWWVNDGQDSEFIATSSFRRAAWMWNYMIHRCHEYFSRADSKNHIPQIQYEQFMREPLTVGEQLLDFLDTDGTSAFRRHLGNARTSSIGKFKHRSSKEIDDANKIASQGLRLLGYQ
jgi:hypothetical protein